MNQKQLHYRLAGFYFVYFLMLGGFAPYFSLYLRKLGFSAVQIGILLALMPLARVFAPTAWAWLADHQGSRRPLVRIATAAAAVACAGLLAAKSFGWLLAVLLVLNVFWCAALPLVEATTMGHLRGRLGDYGRIRVWGSIGFVVSVVALGQILDLTGVLWLPAMLVVLFSLCALAAWALPVDQAPPHHEEHAPLRETVRRPEVIALFTACFLMALAHGPYNTFYSIHLVENGYSKAWVGWLWALSVVAEVFVFLLMPGLMRRFAIPSIISFSLGCAVVRFLIIGWAPHSVVLMAVAQLMHAATFGAHHAAALAAIHHLFRGRIQARGQALYTSLGFGAGGALGGFASGWLWQHAGPALTFTAAAGAALLALFVVAGRLRPAAVAHSPA
ncbi:MAG TPA: MFS transporter [Burkholderiales bacterium]|nr:MFS transporter [Burkholderiales bacterium]